MSEVKVNKISPRSGTDVQLGDSGDTITVPTGATFDASNATATLPATVVTTTGAQTLTNKTIDASQLTGTITPSDNTVTLAKLTATGTKDSTTFLRGDNTFSTLPASGITEADMFGVNDLNINTFTDYTLTSSNTTRISGFGGTTFTKTGTGITIDTNGLVTFPSTGQYFLVFNAVFAILSTDTARYLSAQIRGTNNAGSTITDRAVAYDNNSSPNSSTDYVSASCNLLFTVSDIANDGVYFRAQSSSATSNIRLVGYDGSSMLGTTFQIIKLV